MAKAQLELNLARDIKNNRRVSTGMSARKVKESTPPQ